MCDNPPPNWDSNSLHSPVSRSTAEANEITCPVLCRRRQVNSNLAEMISAGFWGERRFLCPGPSGVYLQWIDEIENDVLISAFAIACNERGKKCFRFAYAIMLMTHVLCLHTECQLFVPAAISLFIVHAPATLRTHAQHSSNISDILKLFCVSYLLLLFFFRKVQI